MNRFIEYRGYFILIQSGNDNLVFSGSAYLDYDCTVEAYDINGIPINYIGYEEHWLIKKIKHIIDTKIEAEHKKERNWLWKLQRQANRHRRK